jgi:tetratricopeptide (TPR) repeat protein
MVLDAYEQFDSAEVCYRRAHLLDMRSFRWLYYLASVQAAQGRHEDAAATLEAALRLKPDDLPSQLRLAESLVAAGRRAEPAHCRVDYTRRPEDAEAHYIVGRAAAARNDLPAAVSPSARPASSFRHGAAHYALAMAHRKLGREEASQGFALYDQNKTAVPPLDDPLRRGSRR